MRVDCRCGCALVPGWGLADYSGWGGLIGDGWSGGWFLGLLDVSWCARLAGVCYPVPAGLLGCSIPGRGARVVVGVLPLDVGGGRVLSCGWLLLGSGWRWLVWRGSGVGWLDCSGRVCSCFPVGSVGGCWLLVWLPVPVGDWHSPACGSMFPRGVILPVGGWLLVAPSMVGVLSPRVAAAGLQSGRFWLAGSCTGLFPGWRLALPPPARGWFSRLPGWLGCSDWFSRFGYWLAGGGWW